MSRVERVVREVISVWKDGTQSPDKHVTRTCPWSQEGSEDTVQTGQHKSPFVTGETAPNPDPPNRAPASASSLTDSRTQPPSCRRFRDDAPGTTLPGHPPHSWPKSLVLIGSRHFHFYSFLCFFGLKSQSPHDPIGAQRIDKIVRLIYSICV